MSDSGECYVGLMSGTSLDGVDGVLVDFDRWPQSTVLAHAHLPFDVVLADELLALNTAGPNELHRAALAGNSLARLYAEVVAGLLKAAQLDARRVQAVGAHGQTVRHRPGEFDATGYTLQLNNPALLAEICRIDVVADLRSRDVAAGGQGAPLVSAFHRAVFGRANETVGVLNIGGISNLTVLRGDGSTIGFDCGPGNSLMDHWCGMHIGTSHDDGGAWAASGKVIEPLLARMRADPYFALTPPKSSGRDRFNASWLETMLLAAHALQASAADVQATLAELTASVCAADLRSHSPGARQLLVCGGGALNRHLLDRLAGLLPGVQVVPSDAQGLPAQQVEAYAFAWLARAFVRRESANLPSVTGASGPRILGALYPAG